MKRLYGLVLALFLCILAFATQPAEAAVIGPFGSQAACERSQQSATVPTSGCYPCGGGWCYETYPSCPPPKQYSGGCIQVITYATNPATGQCCVYPDPCSAPTGWTLSFTGCENAG